MMTGGEGLSHSLAKRLQAHGNVVNLYGPTEATIWCASKKVDADRDQTLSSILPIGRPLDGYSIFVLDETLRPTLDGMMGEIYISGPALANGYIGKPGLTAERFIAAPFGPSGSRMYRTGDLGIRRPNGDIEFLGRADTQIKIHGHRIEPGEIEHQLLSHFQDISRSVVVAKKRGSDLCLVAYLVYHRDKPHQPIEALRAALSKCLPSYMIPSFFLVLDALPYTANGKLNLSALPEPGMAEELSEPAKPASALEKQICDLFSEVTGTEQVGPDDDFFAIGGHSLSAMRLVAKIRDKTSRSVEIKSIFDHPTAKRLASQLLRATPSSASGKLLKGRGRVQAGNM